MASDNKIGFPSPLLGDKSIRLRVIYDKDGLLCLEKPLGVAVDVHAELPKVPGLVDALRWQVKNEKPELASYGFKDLRSVHSMDAEIPAAALVAKDREAAEKWRNLYGSDELTFKFHMIVLGEGPDSPVSCTLPIAEHTAKNEAIVSHKTGKRTSTAFERLESLGNYSLWQASASYLRPHSVRLHAHESKLAIIGETVYSRIPEIEISSLRKLNKKSVNTLYLYSGLHMRLSSILLPCGTEIEVPAPKPWLSMLKKLRN